VACFDDEVGEDLVEHAERLGEGLVKGCGPMVHVRGGKVVEVLGRIRVWCVHVRVSGCAICGEKVLQLDGKVECALMATGTGARFRHYASGYAGAGVCRTIWGDMVSGVVVKFDRVRHRSLFHALLARLSDTI